MKKTRLLVVEDEFITGADLQSALSEMGYDVPLVVDNGREAVLQAKKLRPDAVLMDITLRGPMNGIEAAEKIRAGQGIPVIYLTAHSDDSTFQQAIRSEPFGYIIKPYEPVNLKTCIEMALFKSVMENRLRESERTVLALLNAIPDALALVDHTGTVVAANEPMCRRMALPCKDLVGSQISDLIRRGLIYAGEEMIDDVFSYGRNFTLEDEQGGAWFETSIHPVFEPDGTIERIMIQSRDITGKKKVGEQMMSAGIEQIEQNMEQFQILNDQIRTPLQAIMLYLSLGEHTHREKIEEQVKTIDTLVARLDRGWLESEKVRSFLLRHYTPHIEEEGKRGLRQEKS